MRKRKFQDSGFRIQEGAAAQGLLPKATVPYNFILRHGKQSPSATIPLYLPCFSLINKVKLGLLDKTIVDKIRSFPKGAANRTDF